MTKPLRPANADGTYCYRIGKSYRPKLTTPGPVPSAQVEVAGSRFRCIGRSPHGLSRAKRWGDTEHVISVSTPRRPQRKPCPELCAPAAGARQHVLTATWPEGTAGLEISGKAGEVLVVEVIGQVWAGAASTASSLERSTTPANVRATSDWLRTLVEGACDLVTRAPAGTRTARASEFQHETPTGRSRLSLAMTWIWIGVLLAALVAYGIFRWWRRGHPAKQPPAPLSYSARTDQRLQKNMNKGTKRRRRGKPRGKPPRRP